MMFHCHCRDCQRATGGAFSSAIIVPAEAFKLTQGSPRFHASPSIAGGHQLRGFCTECGSPMIVRGDPATTFIGIHAASLDDPSGFKPQMDIFTSDTQPWARMDPALPKYEQYMPFD